MSLLRLCQKHALIAALISSNLLLAECFEPIGVMGTGNNGGLPNQGAYLIGPGGSLKFVASPTPFSDFTVADINGFGQSILATDAGSAAFLSPEGVLQPLVVALSTHFQAGAINNSGQAILGGNASAYAAVVSPSGVVTQVGAVTENIRWADINNSGLSIVAGDNGYAAFITPSATATSLTTGTGQNLAAASINDSGSAIIGGGGGYAALVSPAGGVAVLPAQSGTVNSVAINASGNAVLGTSFGSAAFVSPTGTVTPLTVTGNPDNIEAVAINDSGNAILAGQIPGPNPYAALVSPSGTVTSLGPFPGFIGLGDLDSASINEFGVGLVGGGGDTAYAALITPSGKIVPLQVSTTPGDYIQVVSLISSLSAVPTQCLNGNNLSFAQYINNNAPEKAYYFLPALIDGSLSSALASAAPTRNAAALYTTNNNLFMLNQSLSRHLRQQHRFLHREAALGASATASLQYEDAEFTASLDEGYQPTQEYLSFEDYLVVDAHLPASNVPVSDGSMTFPPYAIWADLIGALSYQKAEHQTPAFDPVTGGLVLGFEANISSDVHVGGGAAYTYTHIHQHGNAGHAHIDQEYLFAYGFWTTGHFYLDAALWGGLFHIHQVRKIEMTGFDFRSTSDPRREQVAPHLELGLDYTVWNNRFNVQPFAMFDWAASWQQRYKEEGSGPFNMGQKRHFSSFLRSEIGLRFFEAITFHNWRLVFEEKASYVNKKPFHVGRVNAFLVGSPGSFTVETLTSPQNAGVGEFAMIFEPKDTSYPFGTIAYQGEFSEAYQSHQVTLEACWNF